MRSQLKIRPDGSTSTQAGSNCRQAWQIHSGPNCQAWQCAQRCTRMFLHARELSFTHPVGGQRVTLHAPLPAECATLLAALA